jgi:hypothetical protein
MNIHLFDYFMELKKQASWVEYDKPIKDSRGELQFRSQGTYCTPPDLKGEL